MPQVGKENYQFGASRTIEISVYFSKKNGFYCKLPQEVMDILKTGPDTVSGATYSDAVNKTRAFLNDFFSKGIECKKVIVYYIQTLDRTKAHGMHHTGIFDKRYNARNGIAIDYYVKYMTTVNGSQPYITEGEVKEIRDIQRATRWHWAENNGGYSTESWMGWEYIDYSEDLYRWFSMTVRAFQELKDRIDQFFGEEPVHLLQSIVKTSGFLVLGAPQNGDNDSND